AVIGGGRNDGRGRLGLRLAGRRPVSRPFALGSVADGHPAVGGQVFLRHALHVGGGDRLQGGELGVGAGGVALGGEGVAQGEAAAVDGLALAQRAGQQLVLGLVQLGGGRGGGLQAIHL